MKNFKKFTNEQKQAFFETITKDELEDLNGEEWVDLRFYEGMYEISNFGRVKSIGRFVPFKQSEMWVKERILKQQKNEHGALLCSVSQNNIAKKIYISKEMYFSFHTDADYSEENNCIKHIDGNITNNTLENLSLSNFISVGELKYEMNKINKFIKSNQQRRIETDKIKEKECFVCVQILSIEHFERGRRKCRKCHNTANYQKRQQQLN